jgi:hypothetical protein
MEEKPYILEDGARGAYVCARINLDLDCEDLNAMDHFTVQAHSGFPSPFHARPRAQ